jgi:hypothetical protein
LDKDKDKDKDKDNEEECSSSGKKNSGKERLKEFEKKYQKSCSQINNTVKEIKEDYQDLINQSWSEDSHKSGYSHFHLGRVHASFTEGQEGINLKEGWLLDNQSTNDIACNEDMVIPGSIRRVFHHLHLETNAGTSVVEHKYQIKGYPRELWFSDKGLANILSFKYVRKCYPQLKISYQVRDSIFTIHRQNSNLPDMVFPILECGLHYYHPSSDGMELVNTVAKKRKCLPRERSKVQTKQSVCKQS